VKHLPPPTRFPHGMAAQRRASDASRAGATPPPPTRYGATPALQPKAAPRAPAAKPVQAPRPPGPASIQMSRRKEEQQHNFMLLPNDELYQQHVIQRIRHCVWLMKRLAIYCVWAAKQGVTKSISSMVSSKAEVQVGTGLRLKGYSLDASHLTNISVRSSAMSSGLTLSPIQQEAVKELQSLSGATTPQFQRDNVGPDKVIDSCMTVFRAYVETNCTTVVPDAKAILDVLADRCIQALSNAKKSTDSRYQLAIDAATTAKSQTTWEIDEDCEAWKTQCGF